MAFGQPGGNCGVEFVQMASEKVVGAFHNYQPIFARECRDDFLHLFSRAEFIVGSVNEELRLGAIRKKRKIAAVHRDAQPDQFDHAGIAAAHTKAHETPEAEAREEQRDARKLCSEKVERGLHITLLAAPIVVRTAAPSRTSKIEPEDRDAQSVHGLRSVIDDFVVHRAAKERVGMANHRRQ